MCPKNVVYQLHAEMIRSHAAKTRKPKERALIALRDGPDEDVLRNRICFVKIVDDLPLGIKSLMDLRGLKDLIKIRCPQFSYHH